MAIASKVYARQAMIIGLTQLGHSVSVERISADPIEDCDGLHYLVRWHDRSDHAVIRGQARFYPEGQGGCLWLFSLSLPGQVAQPLPHERHVFRGTDGKGLPYHIGPEEVIRFAGNCLDMVLDTHNVFPPIQGPSVSPDGKGGYRVAYETKTLTVEALFHGSVREGRLTLLKLHTPHWEGQPNSVDVFAGYDEVMPGKPWHLRNESSGRTPATVQAL